MSPYHAPGSMKEALSFIVNSNPGRDVLVPFGRKKPRHKGIIHVITVAEQSRI